MVKAILGLVLLVGVCLGLVAPSFLASPDSELMLPGETNDALDNDLEDGDS